jgi:hypothetical protein
MDGSSCLPPFYTMSKFTINTDTHSIIEEMSDSEVGMLFRAIYDYQINGTENPPQEVRIPFKIFLAGLKKDENLSNIRKRAGQNGGRPSKANESKPKQTKAKNSDYQAVTIEMRKEKFTESLKEHVDQYGRDMVNAFFKYWTEPNASNTKMRFELEKTWSVDLRLSNWARNNKEIIPTSTEIKINKI